jgi:O-antigen ligase
MIITAMLLTVSRTAMVGLAVALFVLALKKPEWKMKIMAIAVLMFFGIHMIFPGIFGTFKSTMTPSNVIKSEVGNRGGRLEDYPRMIKEFRKNPLFGRGYGTFDPIRFFFVDNQYLKFLVELGLFGIVAFIGLLYKAISMLFRKEREREDSGYSPLSAIAASIIVFGIVTATFDTFGFPQVTYLFFILLSLGTAYALNLETEKASMQEELTFVAS